VNREIVEVERMLSHFINRLRERDRFRRRSHPS
jgi:hypothetical protein